MTKKKPAPQKPAETVADPMAAAIATARKLRASDMTLVQFEISRLRTDLRDWQARAKLIQADLDALGPEPATDTIPVTVAPTERGTPAKLKTGVRATGKRHVE